MEFRDSPEYKELMELKRIKKFKSSTDNEQVRYQQSPVLAGLERLLIISYFFVENQVASLGPSYEKGYREENLTIRVFKMWNYNI